MTGPMLGSRYALGELLGRGGMAEVHLARDTVLDRDVAVKVFRDADPGGSAADSDARRTGEVRLLASLSHPGLVTVFDAGRGGDSAGGSFTYLVMEYVPGTTLRRRLDDGPLPRDEAARLGGQLAAALAYVHARGIVHRDVKPANILLTADGTAKLTDFGVAKLLDSARLTVTGTTLGTANYLSPEQATGAVLTGASDVYSLGLVLLECLTGELAFPGHGVEAAVARLHRQPIVPATLGPGWVGLLAAMTARDPASRPDATAVATALNQLATGASDATQLLIPTAARSRRPLWLAGAGVGVAAAAAIVAAAWGGGPAPTPPSPTGSTSIPPRSPVAVSTTPGTRPPTSASSTSPSSASSTSRPTVVRQTSAAPVHAPPVHHKPPKKPKGPGKGKGHGKH